MYLKSISSTTREEVGKQQNTLKIGREDSQTYQLCVWIQQICRQLQQNTAEIQQASLYYNMLQTEAALQK